MAHAGQTMTVREVATVEEVGELHVTGGPDTGLAVDVLDLPVVVGTGEGVAVRLNDPRVSRLHCEVRRDSSGGARVRDLGSKNGTWLGGHRVHDAVLAPGGRLRVGGSSLELAVERKSRRRLVWDGEDRLGELIGGSPPMHALFARMARAAAHDLTVLVRGETGTGKELVARALHDAGPRAEGPFVVVDGATLAKGIAELELFGNVRGAFTDAVADRPGAFERAHGGTLFLDEIGDVPLGVQPKLLRVLEQGTVQRIGDTHPISVDARIIAATHRPLENMVNTGAFREDLYHRLCVLELHLPPLRERGSDAERIARALLERWAPGDARAAHALEQALGEHASHPWPGNVRELANLVQRVALLHESAGALAGGVPPRDAWAVHVDLPFSEAKAQHVAEFERRYLSRLLDEAGGNVSEAARRASLSRVHMTRLLRQHGLRGTR